MHAIDVRLASCLCRADARILPLSTGSGSTGVPFIAQASSGLPASASATQAASGATQSFTSSVNLLGSPSAITPLPATATQGSVAQASFASSSMARALHRMCDDPLTQPVAAACWLQQSASCIASNTLNISVMQSSEHLIAHLIGTAGVCMSHAPILATALVLRISLTPASLFRVLMDKSICSLLKQHKGKLRVQMEAEPLRLHQLPARHSLSVSCLAQEGV